MSIRSLTSLAVARDKASPGTPAMGGGGQATVGPAAGGPQIPQQFSDVLTSAIPSEPLAAYTAMLGIMAGAIDATHPRTYLPLRWGAFVAFLLLTVIATAMSYQKKVNGQGGPINKRQSARAFPWAEGGAALIAAGAWGLGMPGSALNTQLTGTVRYLTTGAIVIAGAALLTLLFAPQLKTGTDKPGDPPPEPPEP